MHPVTSKTHATTTSAMVVRDQLVSPSWKPTSRHMTPAMNKPKPRKSNWDMYTLTDFGGVGLSYVDVLDRWQATKMVWRAFTLRKYKRPAAIPPVGRFYGKLDIEWQDCSCTCYPECPSPWDFISECATCIACILLRVLNTDFWEPTNQSEARWRRRFPRRPYEAQNGDEKRRIGIEQSSLPHHSSILGPFFQHNNIANCDEHELDYTTTADPLNASANEEHDKTLTCSAKRRSH